jgi:hypothetical protein
MEGFLSSVGVGLGEGGINGFVDADSG